MSDMLIIETRKCVKKGGANVKYSNLKAELARKGISMEEVSKVLNIHRNSVANKINGETPFTVEEAFKIQNKYFPKLSLVYLFATEEEQQTK